MTRLCEIEGCSGKHKAYGMCRTHYQKSRSESRHMTTTELVEEWAWLRSFHMHEQRIAQTLGVSVESFQRRTTRSEGAA